MSRIILYFLKNLFFCDKILLFCDILFMRKYYFCAILYLVDFMNTFNIIMLSALAVCVIVYLVAFIKSWKIVNFITALLFFPCSCLPLIFSLNKYLPDSFHLRFLSLIALILIFICEILRFFDKHEKVVLAGEVFYILSLFIWMQLFKTTFYVFNISSVSLLIEAVILVVLFLTLIIYIGKQNVLNYPIRLFQIGQIGFINYCGLLTILNVSHLYGYAIFAGSLLLMAEYFFSSIRAIKPLKMSEKTERLIRRILISLSQVLLCLSSLLMVSA